ncbi:MAG: EFR1 family ferrodoxin [Proteobacteria bacterium]|nr:EFR1 family ferrodoxin [Pseudomonadota bacterium]
MQHTYSRRSLLKLMATGAAALATGTVFTSCQKKPEQSADPAGTPSAPNPQANGSESQPKDTENPKRLVFFFTGTGNCLFVASQLSPNVISIPQALKNNELEYEAEEIGIVYPIYGQMMPNIVKKFLNTAKLKAQYFFAIGTYGNRKGPSVDKCAESAQKAGYTFDYIATLLMVDNWLPRFDMDEQLKIDKKIGPNLAKIISDLEERKKYIEPYEENENSLPLPENNPSKVPAGTFDADGVHAKAEDWFTILDTCVACGLCTRVCPRANYTLEGEIAVCKGECELCLACVHACPHKAIVITYGEANPKARYRNPNVSMRDIMKANNQRG